MNEPLPPTKHEFGELVENLCIAVNNYRTLKEDELDESNPHSLPKAIEHWKEKKELTKAAVLNAYDAVLAL